MRDVSFGRVQSYVLVIIDAGRQELEGRVRMARTAHQAAVGLSSEDVGGSCRDSPGRLTNVWHKARVNIDYHVQVDGHLYSVPFRLVHEEVETRSSVDVVEILHGRVRVASHRRSTVRGGFTTVVEHMPSAHRAHAEWTPSRILTWAGKVGAGTRELCEVVLADRPHPEQGLRSCLGILRLGKRYGDVRLEAACRPALGVRARSYRHVESILKNGLDRVVSTDEPLPLTHENVRGRDYFH